jgi:histidine kinase
MLQTRNEVLVHSNEHNMLLQAIATTTGAKVALKRTLISDGMLHASKLNNEYEILRTLSHPGLPHVLELQSVGSEFTLVMEWIEGETLRTHIRKTGKMPVAAFLKAAIDLANIVRYIHQSGFIHKDINPANIMITATGGVKLVDFGISSPVYAGEEEVQSPELIEGTLIYLSPEQTGRTSFQVTALSDIYALGITFYEMLSGKPPFESSDPLEIIHFHLSRKPAVLQAGPEDMFTHIGKIILKMLQKNPDDRYQSISGLLADLEFLYAACSKNEQVTHFTPALHDFKKRYRQSQRLYGRDEETALLLESYREAGQTGSGLVLVGGYSGVGKSAIVKQIHKPVTEQKGRFFSGKFDQFKQKTPYFAFIEAFSDYLKMILSESDAKVAFWKHKLIKILGENVSLITEVIPVLEQIVGKQAAPVKLQPAEQEYRFHMVLVDFIYAFCEPGKPNVIFLDDLQWADLPSLQLVERLLLTPGNGQILVIGAYRNNEVDEMHPLSLTLNQLRTQAIQIRNIELKPLAEEYVAAIVADAFGMNAEEAAALGKVTFSKTSGNPFFINRFLKSVYNDGYVSFKVDKWIWDEDAISHLPYTDNVIDLMTREIAVLPDTTRDILKIASVLGTTFNLTNISYVSELPVTEIFARIQPALLGGYIVPLDKNYRALLISQDQLNTEWQKEAARIVATFRFLHDRVQQAAYALLGDDDRNILHLQSARKLFANTSKDRLGENLFEIIGHFSQSYQLISDFDEKMEVAQLLLLAGTKAKDSTSYDLAVKYLTLALSLSGAAWQSHYDLVFSIHLEMGEAEYLKGSHETAEIYFDEILKYAKTNYEKLQIYYIKSSLYLKISDVHKGLAIGREAMKLFNIRFPEGDLKIRATTAVTLIKYLYLFSTKYKNPERLYNLPDCTDREIILINQFLIDMATNAYMVNQELMMLICLKIIENYIKYGFTDASGWGFSGFSVVVLSALGMSEKGFNLWDITAKLHSRTESQLIKWKLDYTVKCFSTHWRHPLAENLEAIQDNIKACIMNGDPIFTGYSIGLYVWKKSAAGYPIAALLDEISKSLDYLRRNRNTSGLAFSETRVQALRTLAGLNGADLSATIADTTASYEQIIQSGNNTAIAYYYTARIFLLCLSGQHKESVDVAITQIKFKPYLLGNYLNTEWEFYSGLSAMAALAEQTPEQQKLLRTVFNNAFKCLKKWSRDCAANFGGMFSLLAAEEKAVSGNWETALLDAEKAIVSFRENRFIHLEALAHQRVATWSQKRGYPAVAETYIRRAHNLFQNWGAGAVCKRLETEWSAFFPTTTKAAATTEMAGTSAQTVTKSLDMATILKASQSLSGQIKLDDLLRNLMYIVIENVGATRGCLLLENEGEFFVVVEGNAGAEGTKMLKSVPFASSNMLPRSIVQYCRRVKEPVVVANALSDTQYVTDPFVQQHSILSMMCLPIADKGQLIGLLYLENRLLDSVFSGSKLELMKMLSGQIAISIQNAMLVENLEEKVRERTKQIKLQQVKIEAEMRKSDALLLNILPQKTAEDLKNLGYTKAVYYENANVMFTDLVGFTKRAERMSAQEIVNELHEFFSGIDDIMLRHNIEKIKTIGDAYMCASGLSETPDPTSAVRLVRAAKEVLVLLHDFNNKTAAADRMELNLRIGIHTGPLVAGVVGKSKFAYDIWGDTVNTASRMESSGQPGRINISSQTMEAIRHEFQCTSRGKLEAKNKGLIEMFFVE